MTKICDFPYPTYHLFPYLWLLWIYEELFVEILNDNDEKSVSKKTYHVQD